MPQWGMVIDLGRCTGCSACVVACQAENNVPVAGPDRAARGGVISWIRIDRQVIGRWPDLRARFVPVLCQHCDEAPCVPACGAGATYETPEGLNAQVNARCVGLGSCIGACPYHVRFYNEAAPSWPGTLADQINPDVEVRSAGMAEKCTFCVQRIRRAGREGRTADPACAQSCPSQAIQFGDLDDPSSAVARRAGSAGAFRLLEDLGTRPRVIYIDGPPRDGPSDGS